MRITYCYFYDKLQFNIIKYYLKIRMSKDFKTIQKKIYLKLLRILVINSSYADKYTLINSQHVL